MEGSADTSTFLPMQIICDSQESHTIENSFAGYYATYSHQV